jgi:hypothetical protein
MKYLNTTKAHLMMWVSFTTKGNKQNGKWLAELWKVQKWIKVKRKPPNVSSWQVPMEDWITNKLPKVNLSQPHFEGSVRSPLTLAKMGLKSPPGLPKTQSSIAGIKTPCLEVIFILLERSWSVDVQNGLAWAIWTSSAKVMVERRAWSQTGTLTPDH